MIDSTSLMTATPETPLATIAGSVERLLGESPYWAVRQLRCRCEDDQIVLHGTVSSFYLKQVAQAQATRVGGAFRLQIDVEVHPDERHVELVD